MDKRKDISETAQEGTVENVPQSETSPVASGATPAESASAPAVDSPSLIPENSPDIVALRADAPSGAKVSATAAFFSDDDRAGETHAESGAAGNTATHTAPPSRAAASASSRFAVLAASVALAAAIGAMIGSLTTAGFASLYAVSSTPHHAAAAADEAKAVTKLLTQARADIAALKTSIESSNKAAATQFARMSERFDRADKAQADPAAKITTIADTLSRVERKLVSADVTGSVPDKAVARPAVKEPQKMAVIEGWFVRDFYRGHAIVESMRGGVFEVGPGSTLPGLGRVEAVRQQDGAWVVVTPKGMILSMR